MKFTARELLAQLKVEGREWLLNQPGYYPARQKTSSQHQVGLALKTIRREPPNA